MLNYYYNSYGLFINNKEIKNFTSHSPLMLQLSKIVTFSKTTHKMTISKSPMAHKRNSGKEQYYKHFAILKLNYKILENTLNSKNFNKVLNFGFRNFIKKFIYIDLPYLKALKIIFYKNHYYHPSLKK